MADQQAFATRSYRRLIVGSMLLIFCISTTDNAIAEPVGCELSHTPLVFFPTQQQCLNDEDGNGLDDEIELEIAKCLVPVFRFDSAENALKDDEPKVLFSIIAAKVDDEETPQESPYGSKNAIAVHIKFGVFYSRDGGPVTENGFFCQKDNHVGDSTKIELDALIKKDNGGVWMVYPGRLVVDDYDSESDEYSYELFEKTTRPVLYPSAGKHHWYVKRENTKYKMSLGIFGHVWCRDRADGSILREALPVVLKHAPPFAEYCWPYVYYKEQALFPWVVEQKGWDYEAVAMGKDWFSNDYDHWINGCAFIKHGTRQPAINLQKYDLDDIGWPGQNLCTNFFDTDNPPISKFSHSKPENFDSDGDKLNEVWWYRESFGITCDQSIKERDPYFKDLSCEDACIKQDPYDPNPTYLFNPWEKFKCRDFHAAQEIIRADDPCPFGPQYDEDKNNNGIDDACDDQVSGSASHPTKRAEATLVPTIWLLSNDWN